MSIKPNQLATSCKALLFVPLFLTKTVKLRGALVMFLVGDRALGMCSTQKDVGRILRDKRITR